MSTRSVRVQGALAGVGVFLADVWPLLLIWWAGASGSVGDLSEIDLIGLGLLYAGAVAATAGWLMVIALRRAANSAQLGRLDPWGAYAFGVGIYNLALTAVPGLIYGLLLIDENRSLRDRAWLVDLLWVGGHLVAAAVSVIAARWLLGSRLEPLPSTTETNVERAG